MLVLLWMWVLIQRSPRLIGGLWGGSGTEVSPAHQGAVGGSRIIGGPWGWALLLPWGRARRELPLDRMSDAHARGPFPGRTLIPLAGLDQSRRQEGWRACPVSGSRAMAPGQACVSSPRG